MLQKVSNLDIKLALLETRLIDILQKLSLLHKTEKKKRCSRESAPQRKLEAWSVRSAIPMRHLDNMSTSLLIIKKNKEREKTRKSAKANKQTNKNSSRKKLFMLKKGIIKSFQPAQFSLPTIEAPLICLFYFRIQTVLINPLGNAHNRHTESNCMFSQKTTWELGCLTTSVSNQQR